MDLFGTAGVRGDVVARVTPDLALAVGQAAGLEAGADESDVEFVVARDGRTTGPALPAAVASGLASAGATVERAGALPTPALAFASRGRRGVMLTASHNPPTDNGIKLFVDGVEYGTDREEAIESLVEADRPPARWDRWGTPEACQPLSAYREAVVAYARDSVGTLDGLSVAVDCGNGTGGLATPYVLDRLGARVVALNANVDGHFPARESKPTEESLAAFRRFVADRDVDLGVAHDGDADRVVFLDPDGDVVHEDTVVAVLAEHYVRSSDASDPVVVTTPNASARIDDRVDEAGGRVERIRLGALHEGVAAAEAGGGTVAFAAEPWKHIHPAFGGWMDGVASAAVFAGLVAGATPSTGSTDATDATGTADATGTSGAGLAALREPIDERPYRKVNVPCPDDAKDATMEGLAAAIPAAFPDAEVTTTYGVRLERDDGSWALVRPSGTEPFVRIYAESDDVDGLVAAVRSLVEDAVSDADAG
ncbi:MAG: phosphomannomutase [Salinigranum sp.]